MLDYSKESRKNLNYFSDLFSPKNFHRKSNPNINSFNYKERNSFQFNKMHLKENNIINKSPINKKKIKSLKINPLKKIPTKMNSISSAKMKKKKIFRTGIFGNKKFSIKLMELNIRKKIIDMTSKIEKSELSSKFDDFYLTPKKFMNSKSSKNIQSYFLDNDNERPSLKLINKPLQYKLSNKSINNSFNKGKSNKSTPKAILKKISSKSILCSNREMSKLQISEKNYRKINRIKILYDSFEDNETDIEKENEGFFINPNSKFILIFDFLIIISTLIVALYNPYYISTMNCFLFHIPFIIKYIYFFIDILFIFDLLLGFCRAYYNQKLQIVNKVNDIIKHYLSTDFVMDFFESLPVFSLLILKCEKKEKNYCINYNMSSRQILLIIFTSFKQLKFYKMVRQKKNIIIFKLYELTNENNIAEKVLNICIIFFSAFFGFYTIISIHIFIANQNPQSWIITYNLQDSSISLIFLNSFYFIITTITTVGYGDMLGNSLAETIFKIILLTLGISLYSWIVSNIGNYVNNESRISIRFNKDEGILEEIRIAHPNMPYKLYNQIFHHLELRKLRQQKLDVNLLINSLPYSLRNTILFTIHKQVIRNFKIFKKCQNSDFINQILTNFIPLFSRKNAILIYENQLIENLIFVKEGRLSLEAAIDIEFPEKSINDYIFTKFIDINDIVADKKNDSLNKLTSKSIIQTEVDLNLNTNHFRNNTFSEMDDSTMEREIGRCEFEGEKFEESNYHFINIVNITKNESYGMVYMFLSKPSPLSLRVKSKKAELFLLRKFDAFSISKRFPNIWKKQYNKSYINMNSIKKRTLKHIKKYCDISGLIFDENPKLVKKHNYTIKEILEKAKQKENITNIIKSDTFFSNIFGGAEIKKNNSITAPPKILKVNNKIRISQLDVVPAKIKSFVSNDKKVPLENTEPKNSKDKNNFVSFRDNNAQSTNIKSSQLSNKLKKSETSKGKRPSLMSRYKYNSNMAKKSVHFSNNEQSSITNLLKDGSQNNIMNIKIENNQNTSPNSKHYISKLKKKIKKLKISKLYYKTLIKKISDKLKEFKKQNNKNCTNEIIMTLINYKHEREKNMNIDNDKNEENKEKTNNNNENNTKIINNVIVQNNNNYICSFSDFISSDSNKSSSSTEKKNELIINKVNEFTLFAEYRNLKELTKGEITKNKKFMNQSLNYIKDLYNKFKGKKLKKFNNSELLLNNINFLKEKPSKNKIPLYSGKALSSVISDDKKNLKNIKKYKILNNLKNDKDSSKIDLLNNNNISNYSFKINFGNKTNINDDTSKDNYNITNDLNNEININKKIKPIIEYDWEQKISKNFSRTKDILFSKNEKIKEEDFISEHNSCNSSIEKKIKSDIILRQKEDALNLDKGIITKDNEKIKNNFKEKEATENGFCFLF